MTVNKFNNLAITPEFCHLWKEKSPDTVKYLQIVKEYAGPFNTDADEAMRSVKKCSNCGQLYFYEMLEWRDDGGNDPIYRTIIPVKEAEDADKLAKLSQFDVLDHLPQIRYNWPDDAKHPSIFWEK